MIPFIEGRANWPLILSSLIIVAVGSWLAVSLLTDTLGLIPLPRGRRYVNQNDNQAKRHS